MSLMSWSEPSMLRNFIRLDPFQHTNRVVLADVNRRLLAYHAVGAMIVRAITFPRAIQEAA